MPTIARQAQPKKVKLSAPCGLKTASQQSQSPTKEQQLSVAPQHVDVPELAETSADSIEFVFFNGQPLSINFAVTRFNQTLQSGSVSAKRLPACRPVLTPAAAVEFPNQIQ
jgi:hypothetical protein